MSNPPTGSKTINMEARELRIGNWVGFDTRNKRHPQFYHVQVKELLKKDAIISDPLGLDVSLSYSGKGLCPIPLTPEILEKCGFEKHKLSRMDYYEFKINEKEKFSWEPGGNVEYGILGVSQVEWSAVRIAYLHQLQNLYFALTEEELTYTP